MGLINAPNALHGSEHWSAQSTLNTSKLINVSNIPNVLLASIRTSFFTQDALNARKEWITCMMTSNFKYRFCDIWFESDLNFPFFDLLISSYLVVYVKFI